MLPVAKDIISFMSSLIGMLSFPFHSQYATRQCAVNGTLIKKLKVYISTVCESVLLEIVIAICEQRYCCKTAVFIFQFLLALNISPQVALLVFYDLNLLFDVHFQSLKNNSRP